MASVMARMIERLAPPATSLPRPIFKSFSKYLRTGAMPDAIQNTWQRIVSEFFPTSVYQPTYEFDIEVYGEGDMDSDDYESEIWIPVKKA